MRVCFGRNPKPRVCAARRFPVQWLGLFLFVLLLGRAPQAHAEPRSIWVWDANAIVDPVKKQQLVSLCLQKSIGTVFISTGSAFVEAPLNASKVQVSWAQLAAFTTHFHNNGIKVYSLDGDASHALTANHYKPLGRLDRALDYNASYTQASLSRLDGFQWDIEPYLLTEWKNGTLATQTSITQQYLTLMSSMADMVASSSPTLKLGAVVPFWWDDPVRSLTFDGANKVPSHHILDILNGTVGSHMAIMAYRDTSAATIPLAQGEINYAQSYASGVKVWVGQETIDVQPTNITFWQETHTQFNAAAAGITAQFTANSVYAGIAIHDWPGYVALVGRP